MVTRIGAGPMCADVCSYTDLLSDKTQQWLSHASGVRYERTPCQENNKIFGM